MPPVDQFQITDIDVVRIGNGRIPTMQPMVQNPGDIVAVNDAKDPGLLGGQLHHLVEVAWATLNGLLAVDPSWLSRIFSSMRK